MSPDRITRRILPTEAGDTPLPPAVERTPRRIYNPNYPAAAQSAMPDTDPTSTPPENQGVDDVEASLKWFGRQPDKWKAEFAALGLTVSHLVDLYLANETNLDGYQDSKPAPFTHAGTGKPVPLQEAQDQIADPCSPGLQDKLNVEIGEAVRKLTNM